MDNPFECEVLDSYSMTEDKQEIVFRCESSRILGTVVADCCSTSWIEYIEAPDSIKGRKVVEIEEMELPDPDPEGALNPLTEDDVDVLIAYQTILRLDNGESIKIEYRNDSNGYYGGDLLFQKMQ